MTDYVKNTDYAAKDALISGNPSKLIKGTELGAEFDDIATAIATKADLDSPALVTPDLGTPSAGDLRNCSMAVAPAIGATTPSTGDFTNLTATVSTGDALTITNDGTGNCLVVNDANPDSTPFVIDASGRAIFGNTTINTKFVDGTRYGALTNEASGTTAAAVDGASYSAILNSTTTSAGPRFRFGRSKANSLQSVSAVTSGDDLGAVIHYGADGTYLTNAVQYGVLCDGTVSSGVVPGAFYVKTANASGTMTEAIKIDSAQKTTFSGVVRLKSYTVATLPTGAAGDTAFVTNANATTFASVVAGGGANGVPVYHDGTNWRIG